MAVEQHFNAIILGGPLPIDRRSRSFRLIIAACALFVGGLINRGPCSVCLNLLLNNLCRWCFAPSTFGCLCSTIIPSDVFEDDLLGMPRQYLFLGAGSAFSHIAAHNLHQARAKFFFYWVQVGLNVQTVGVVEMI
ncbi:hypothetical protein PanWU01x14_141120 [Parasponia andersonii]|uniref:Uncharacterized protein n=1 Tax=Parasponia andersonii TaxID=3476 RepID=A0A2P5CM41_PARAD|nr:hypothetical protein PanWU01x14_141120 [Parasponia andersonii]